VDRTGEPINAGIRRAKLTKVPYILVVGDDDVAAGTVGVNRRGSKRPDRGVPFESFAEDLITEIADRGSPEAAESVPGGGPA
jgi:threonyl-tRNA synthetase